MYSQIHARNDPNGVVVADSTKDIVKSDPIETLQAASKISLQGGGVLLFVAIVGVYQMNTDPKWQIDSWLIFSLLIGAVLLGLAGTLARMYDAKLRVQLALKLIDKKGTADAEEAKKIPLIDPEVEAALQKPLVQYLLFRSDTPNVATVPNGKNAKAGPGQ
jgi:hypothetical protein